MNDQLSFDYNEPQKIETLHITYNNDICKMEIAEIFDNKKYDTLRCVTYSISPAFLNKYISDFLTVEIVVGILEDKVQRGAYDFATNLMEQINYVLKNESIKTFDGLNLDIKTKLDNKTFDIKIPYGYTIHSKFYLLSNSQNNENRIILGSANLSENAFSSTNNQFENILIYDNSDLFNIYSDYYESLSPFLTEYFPKSLLIENSKFINKNTTEIDRVLILDDNKIDEIQNESINNLIEKVDKDIKLSKIPSDSINQIQNIDSKIATNKLKNTENEKYEIVTENIITQIVNNKTKVPTIKKKPTISKIIKDNKKILKVKKNDESTERDVLYSKPENRNTSSLKSGLVYKNKISNEYLNFGEYADKEEIRKSLVLIDKFIKTFDSFVVKYSDEYGQRVMEAILYTFTSPFIYEIKQLARTNEEKNDIPQFLFIGGTANSGKSSLLKILSKMMGISNLEYYNFNDLGSGGRAKSDRVKTIENWSLEDNVYPIMIDEISLYFFQDTNYGRELVVNTSNYYVDSLDPFPVTIGTTNADSYALPQEARRRSYYLKLDKVFSEEYKKDSPLVYLEIYNSVNNTLFKDFVMRMAERLENKYEYEWNYFGNSNKVDFLYQTREIFREYYNMCEMPLPRYFPDKRYSDDYETNQEKWKKLYKRSGEEFFIFDEISGNLFYNIKLLDENSKLYGTNESAVYKQALNPRVVVGTLSGIDIELDTLEFFKWIEVDNPYKNYYKDIIKTYFIENEKSIIKDSEFVYIPSDKISKNEEQLNTIYNWIKNYISIQIDDNYLKIDKEDFYKWLDIAEKKSLLEKLFK